MPDLRHPLDSLIRDIRDRQSGRWEAGDHVLLEPLLADHPELLAEPEALLHLIYAEALLREDHGERPGVDEYVRRFPSFEAALRRQFAFHEAVGAMATDGSFPGSSTTVHDGSMRGAREARSEIGPYEILGEVGRGGMGVVYKGRHRTLTTRLAAIKVLHPAAGGEEARERFLAEARAVASLHHPNIVRIYDVCDPAPGEGEPFVALEYVEGGSLADRINGTPLPPREAADLLLPLAEAMHQAHLQGIIHRDLKPANVMLAGSVRARSVSEGGAQSLADAAGSDLIPKITDFGLAKQLDADSALTRTGAIVGTPSYMAPEQASGRNHEVGPLADVYGLGAVLYEMLTGRPPFKADTVLNTLNQVISTDPVPPRSLQPGVPRDLETICLKCLLKDPAKRYPSAGELAGDLRRFLQGEPIRARPTGTAERAAKWVRRRPAAASLIGAGGLALAGLVALWASFTIRLEEQKRDAIEQRDEARKQKKVALAERAEAQRQSRRAGHLLALMATAVDEIAVAARSAKAAESSSGSPGAVLFKLACFYARASRTLAGDRDMAGEDRDRLAEQFAVSAVRLLGCAETVGFFERGRAANRQELHKSKDLAVLRSRPDYKRLVSRLR
jgi:serine/threonine protein kinase